MNLSHMDRAQVLAEALPYIQKYYKKTIVVKYGGNAMISQELREAVIADIILLKLVGINVVVVHGGGPEINHMLDKVGKQSRFVDGLRYTDQETMDIVQMVLCGKVNKDLVGTLIRAGGNVVKVDATVIRDAIANDYIPVISTVARGMDGESSYNINADTAAAQIAVALGAEKLILLTDIRGLLRDPHDESTLIPEVRASEVAGLVKEGIIGGGMIPKTACCVDAIQHGVHRTHILDGRIPHSILIEVLSHAGIGTMIW